jgi:glycosyltransferase involved in cell wall biosynthesis
MAVTVSVIVPAYNSVGTLERCLAALQQSRLRPIEVIVVDDGSKDATRETASKFPVTILSTGGRMGPAFARNVGANAATGDVLFFLDSDVCVRASTLSRIADNFDADPELDALIGAYDSTPDCKDFISQYRNIMHSYVHHTGAENASTFWSGCGAIRRDLFLEHSGFNEQYGRPAIEDIELGYRLIRAGHKIILDRAISVTHLKKWTFWGLLKTDILDRGIPWTELILRDRFMPNDLNLQLSQRVSVALVFVLVALSGIMALLSGAYLLIPLFAMVFLMLARWWVEVGSSRRPRSAYAMLISTVAVIAIFAWHYKMWALIPPVMVSPVLLLVRHRYSKERKTSTWVRWAGIAYICCSVCAAAVYLPANRLTLMCFALLALLGLMNTQFYIFLAGKRGVTFMLAAIPFHLLYHFYNGLSFIIGVFCYFWKGAERDRASVRLPAKAPGDVTIGRAES